jgi:GNAT superfamily N-acetyltransferase
LRLTFEQREAFAAYKASYLPEEIGANPAFRSAIAGDIDKLLHLAEPEVCESRRRGANSELAGDQFRERVLIEDGARVAVGGIRFRNNDLRFPFVGIEANFDLFEPKLIGQVASTARREFHAFEPKGILVSGSPNIALSGGFERWSHTLFGSMRTISDFQLPAEMTCSFPSTVEFYDEYRDAYSAWQASSPVLGSFVRIEAQEDLEAAAAKGLLASFSDKAGWCGVVAAQEEALYGTRALYIFDIFLDIFDIFLAERWRGKGAARAMDAALVSKAASHHSLIWEHIHSENLPSLRVALGQGRSVIETEYFFPFQEDGRLQISA